MARFVITLITNDKKPRHPEYILKEQFKTAFWKLTKNNNISKIICQ
jgi:hypothetical protein